MTENRFLADPYAMLHYGDWRDQLTDRISERLRDLAERASGRHVSQVQRIRNKYGPVFDYIREAFFALDEARLTPMLDEYGARYGKAARAYAARTIPKWRAGEVSLAGQTMRRLLEFLPRHLSDDERLTLLHLLRKQTLQRVRHVDIGVTIRGPQSVEAVVEHVMRLVRREVALPFPRDFYEITGWLNEGNTPLLANVIRESEQAIAARRLASLLVELGHLHRLAMLEPSAFRTTVRHTVVIPTAKIHIRFHRSFWRNVMKDTPETNDQVLLVKLQELAVTQQHLDGEIGFIDYVMRTLTPEEAATLRKIAAKEGLNTEILLRELQVKTVAAQGDIDSTIQTAERLKATGQKAKISSTHTTASGTTEIEIENKRGCASAFLLLTCIGTLGGMLMLAALFLARVG